ncbi:hypothetical protein [Dokdonella sp.]|uniref:hypothetical protein n=1 Tax=Dokdonella sp. TaxID=2291710 RepID=UPI003782E01E
MALYKYGEHLRTSTHAAFDEQNEPGAAAAHAGIYRCVACGDEIGIAKGHTLPPQNHHQHAAGLGRIRWQLIVYAQSKG